MYASSPPPLTGSIVREKLIVSDHSLEKDMAGLREELMTARARYKKKVR